MKKAILSLVMVLLIVASTGITSCAANTPNPEMPTGQSQASKIWGKTIHIVMPRDLARQLGLGLGPFAGAPNSIILRNPQTQQYIEKYYEKFGWCRKGNPCVKIPVLVYVGTRDPLLDTYRKIIIRG